MAIPTNKEELIFEIENNYLKLKTDLNSIPSNLICSWKSPAGIYKGLSNGLCLPAIGVLHLFSNGLCLGITLHIVPETRTFCYRYLI